MADSLLPDGVDSLPVPQGDLPLRHEAERRLADSAGVTAETAGSLLDAAMRAAAVEVLDALASDAPLPSSVADLRALRLYRISALLGRTPTSDEVRALMRIPLPTAASAIRRMEASYPSIRERDLLSAVRRVRTRPLLRRVPGEPDDWYEISYRDEHDLEAFLAKLRRLGVVDVRPVADDELARAIPKETPTGANVLDELGLQHPAGEP
jgi:hypothetical protein